MNLVFKNNNTTIEGGVKLYRDALVSEGTLMLVDFSNKGALIDNDINNGVYDLARDAAENLNVYTSPVFKNRDNKFPIVTNGGIPLTDWGYNSLTDFNTGINFKGISKYLYSKQPKSVLIMWVKIDTFTANTTNGTIVRTNDDVNTINTGNVNITMANANSPAISVRFANKVSLNNYNIGDNLYTQIAIEFTGSTTANKVYKNASFIQNGTTIEGGFIPNISEDILSLGFKSNTLGKNSPLTIYRVIIEDLNVSKRTAQEVIQEDYNYVNALDKYSGIEKRPYANL